MSRVVKIVYILFCLELGVFLFILPWIPLWSQNYFVANYPWVSGISLNYFFRGAISGLGVADIWLGVYETWRLCHQLSWGTRGSHAGTHGRR